MVIRRPPFDDRLFDGTESFLASKHDPWLAAITRAKKHFAAITTASPQANGKCLQWNLEMWHWHKNPMVRYKCTPRWRRFDLMARPQSFSSIALCSVSSLATWSGRFTIFLSPICLLIGTRRSRWRYTYTQILDLQTEIKTYTHTMPVQWAAVT